MEPDNKDGLKTSTGGPRLKKLKEQTLVRFQNSSIIEEDLRKGDMQIGARWVFLREKFFLIIFVFIIQLKNIMKAPYLEVNFSLASSS